MGELFRASVINKDCTGKQLIEAILSVHAGKPYRSAEMPAEVERRSLAVDLLVNNAGLATHGLLEDIPANRDHDEIMVNVAAVVGLTHAFVPGMLARGGRAAINVASTATFQPLPFMAVYGAT